MSNKGTIYLIPTTLGTEDPQPIMAPQVYEVIQTIDHYVVEHEKHARRYLRKLNHPKPIAELEFLALNKHTDPAEIPSFLQPALDGNDMGIISEAGCPGVADPGAAVVQIAHRKGIKVVPLIGPSSILLALMSSGLNGQSFAFHGYLPKDRKDRNNTLRQYEQAAKRGQTQIFMDTPFRNNHVVEDLMKTLSPDALLCIAADLTMPSEYVSTKSMRNWKKQQVPNLHKRPCLFLLGS